MNKASERSERGFTLIELLVVISIIGILAAIATVSYTAAQKQARDTQRKSDLDQYRSALESFANANNGLYPYGGGLSMSDLCTSALGNYMSACPDDPLHSSDASRTYKYRNNGSGSAGDPTATKYSIYVNGGLDVNTLGSPGGTTWVVCSNGNTGAVPNHMVNVVAFCP